MPSMTSSTSSETRAFVHKQCPSKMKDNRTSPPIAIGVLFTSNICCLVGFTRMFRQLLVRSFGTRVRSHPLSRRHGTSFPSHFSFTYTFAFTCFRSKTFRAMSVPRSGPDRGLVGDELRFWQNRLLCPGSPHAQHNGGCRRTLRSGCWISGLGFLFGGGRGGWNVNGSSVEAFAWIVERSWKLRMRSIRRCWNLWSGSQFLEFLMVLSHLCFQLIQSIIWFCAFAISGLAVMLTIVLDCSLQSSSRFSCLTF